MGAGFSCGQIRIEKSECMRRLNDARAGGPLFAHELPLKLLHLRPMHARAIMVLGMVAVVEPEPVVELVIGAHAPGERDVRLASIMQVVAVEVREAVAEIPEGKEENDEPPVEDSGGDIEREERDDLK